MRLQNMNFTMADRPKSKADAIEYLELSLGIQLEDNQRKALKRKSAFAISVMDTPNLIEFLEDLEY